METFTNKIVPENWEDFRKILSSSGFFYDFEIDIVKEILDETMAKGQERSGYYWLKMYDGDLLAGFSVFGPNPSSTVSWDLYWIAVDNRKRNRRLGSRLIREVERFARKSGARILWIETSGRDLYKPTAAFYTHNAYEKVAVLKDFYAIGDDKVVFRKAL